MDLEGGREGCSGWARSPRAGLRSDGQLRSGGAARGGAAGRSRVRAIDGDGDALATAVFLMPLWPRRGCVEIGPT